MTKKWLPVIAVGLFLAVGVALLSPLASSHPDGLERVAEDKEFADKAKDPPYEIIADYVFPGVENETLATVLSALVGVAIMAVVGFGIAYGLRLMARNGRRGADTPSPGGS